MPEWVDQVKAIAQEMAKGMAALPEKVASGAFSLPYGDINSALAYVDARKKVAGKEIGELMSNPLETIKRLGGNVADDVVQQGPEQMAMNFSPMGMAGALRVGGNPALMAAHGTSMSKLQGLKELQSPSFAITKDAVHNDFSAGRHDGVLLIPKVGALDPATSASTIFNRDAYTPRRWQSAEQDPNYPGTRAQARLDDRLKQRELRGGEVGIEGLSENVGPSQNAAILESPTFKSFKDYENSPQGARTLITHENDVDIPLYDVMFNRLQNKLDVGDWGEIKRMAGGKGEDARTARAMIQLARNAPSHYGELKALGNVQVSPQNFAGAIAQPGNAGDYTVQQLLKLFHEQTGIPYTTPSSLTGPQGIFRIADEMQKIAGPVRK